MNELQANNTLDWVEALLSGKYNHGKDFLYNAHTQCYCAVGVALEINGWPVVPDLAVDPKGDAKAKAMDARLPTFHRWFTSYFWLHRSPEAWFTISDSSKNFLAVAVLLLDAVPSHSFAIRKRKEALNVQLRLEAV